MDATLLYPFRLRCLIAHAWWMNFMAMQENVSNPTDAMQLPPISNEAIVRKGQS